MIWLVICNPYFFVPVGLVILFIIAGIRGVKRPGDFLPDFPPQASAHSAVDQS